MHAPVLVHLAHVEFSKEKFDTLLNILEGRINKYTIDKVYPINVSAKRAEYVTGKLTGGNLTLVESSIGTCWEIQTHGKIVFLEDIHSKPEWIYRSMHHLKESGRLRGVHAIVFGKFTNSGCQKEIASFLRKFASEIDAPVYVTDQFGHGDYNQPLIYNADASLQNNQMTINAR